MTRKPLNELQNAFFGKISRSEWVKRSLLLPDIFLINSTNYVLFVTKVQELFTCSLSMSECINFLIIKLSYSLKFNKVLSLSFSFVNLNTINRGQMYTKTFITVLFQSRWCTNATVVFNSISRN